MTIQNTANELKEKIRLCNGVIKLSKDNPRLFLTVSILGGHSSENTLKNNQKELGEYLQQARDNLEKLGCGKRFEHGVGYAKCGFLPFVLCPDCQQAKEIYEGILDVKQNNSAQGKTE